MGGTDYLGPVNGPVVEGERDMSPLTMQCGKREYVFESRITKNGHRYLMITEKSSGRLSKVMVFHDHFEVFRSAIERTMNEAPTPEPVTA